MSNSFSYQPRKSDSVTALLAVTGLFAIYGPTFDAICSTGIAKPLLWVLLFIASAIFITLFWTIHNVAQSRLKQYIERETEIFSGRSRIRNLVIKVLVFFSVLTITAGPLLLIGLGVFETVSPHLNRIQAQIPSLGFCGASSFHWSSLLQLILAIFIVVLVFLTGRYPSENPKIPVWFPFVLASVIFLSLILLNAISPAGFKAKEADFVPYTNIFAIALLLISGLQIFAGKLVSWLFADFKQHQEPNFYTRLLNTELFQGTPVTPGLSWTRICYGLFVSPVLHLPHLLLMPAFLALLVPSHLLYPVVGIAFVASWVLLTWGGMFWRWDQMIFMVTRYFFRGLPLLVSIIIIGLGIARVLGVHYVATVLDVARFSVVTMLVFMLYSLSWMFEHFTNRQLTGHLMTYLGAGENQDWLEYDYAGPVDPVKNDVPGENRCIQRHGASRFSVVGIMQKEDGSLVQVYHIWDTLNLFRKLSGDDGSSPQAQDNLRGIEAFRSLRRRVLFYRGLMSFFSIVLLGGVLFLVNHFSGKYDELEPVISVNGDVGYHSVGNEDASASLAKPPFSLTERLKTQAKNKQPAILLAASGGGTRAALYAYSVLRGIADLGQIDNIILTSGVSGGGVSLAYFAAHHEELLKAEKTSDVAWLKYRERMAAPFVKDVLEGILEPRIYWKTRLGILLEESFVRHFGDNVKGKTLYDADIGLIFNTSITALPCNSAHLTTRLFGCTEEKPLTEAFTVLSGGRLILTNLDNAHAFHQIPQLSSDKKLEGESMLNKQQRKIAADVFLPYKVIQDNNIRLTQAGALNANFPPVFFDASIEIKYADRSERFYVTDGGATDNRGLISLLYALRNSLNQLGPDEIPQIHIVVAEASASSYDYESALGLGTAFSSAKEKLASGLINELLADVKSKSPASQVAYLNMPAVLRSRGGLGTHWMMPGSIQIKNPYTVDPGSDDPKTLSADQFKCIMDILYASDQNDDSECSKTLKIFGSDAEKIKEKIWIGKTLDGMFSTPDYHAENWEAFSEHFR